jgi:glycosyltransferase involved in cell wall biosynthesis
VSWLTEELVGLGHDVTLFASGDSKTSARLASCWPKAMRLSRPAPDPFAAYGALMECVAQRAREFDVVHCHFDWIHLPLLTRLAVPFATTLHGRLDLPHMKQVSQHFSGAGFVSISDHQRTPAPNLNWLATIHHGMPLDCLRGSCQHDGYLAFLGRIAPEKRPDIAIAWAKAAGMPLKIAAKIPRAENRYFKEKVEPHVDNKHVEFVGEVDERGKQKLLGRATAMLFPIDWPEPFGLVMIEAMACGTPVIAFPRGSVPEVLEHGVTGFLVKDDEEAVQAIGRASALDRGRIRARFEERFSSRRMAEEYVAIFERLAGARSMAPASPAR